MGVSTVLYRKYAHTHTLFYGCGNNKVVSVTMLESDFFMRLKAAFDKIL